MQQQLPPGSHGVLDRSGWGRQVSCR